MSMQNAALRLPARRRHVAAPVAVWRLQGTPTPMPMRPRPLWVNVAYMYVMPTALVGQCGVHVCYAHGPCIQCRALYMCAACRARDSAGSCGGGGGWGVQHAGHETVLDRVCVCVCVPVCSMQGTRQCGIVCVCVCVCAACRARGSAGSQRQLHDGAHCACTLQDGAHVPPSAPSFTGHLYMPTPLHAYSFSAPLLHSMNALSQNPSFVERTFLDSRVHLEAGPCAPRAPCAPCAPHLSLKPQPSL